MKVAGAESAHTSGVGTKALRGTLPITMGPPEPPATTVRRTKRIGFGSASGGGVPSLGLANLSSCGSGARQPHLPSTRDRATKTTPMRAVKRATAPKLMPNTAPALMPELLLPAGGGAGQAEHCDEPGKGVQKPGAHLMQLAAPAMGDLWLKPEMHSQTASDFDPGRAHASFRIV